MTLAVTGATGHLGRLVLADLLERGVAPDQIVAIGRATDRLADFAARGVVVRAADYNDPASLDAALAGVDRLVFISASEVGQRIAQHRAIVDAAVRAGVAFIAYTSITRATTSSMLIAGEHKATEAMIEASGIRYAFLRDSWYLENYIDQLPTYLAYGIAGAVGEGKVSAALRRDYAAAAAAVITNPPTESAVFELGGKAFTMSQLAAEVAAQTGRPVAYSDMPEAAFRDVLVGAGLPAPLAAILADADRGIGAGDLFVEGDDLGRLIGRPATPLADAVREAVAALPAAATA
jgi:NAD(P)H dehydrogenase (quinone)